MHLESWIHAVINANLKSDEEFRRFAGKDFLRFPSRTDVETYQLYRLRQTLRTCLKDSAFYRELFGNARALPENNSRAK